MSTTHNHHDDHHNDDGQDWTDIGKWAGWVGWCGEVKGQFYISASLSLSAPGLLPISPILNTFICCKYIICCSLLTSHDRKPNPTCQWFDRCDWRLDYWEVESANLLNTGGWEFDYIPMETCITPKTKGFARTFYFCICIGIDYFMHLYSYWENSKYLVVFILFPHRAALHWWLWSHILPASLLHCHTPSFKHGFGPVKSQTPHYSQNFFYICGS